MAQTIFGGNASGFHLEFAQAAVLLRGRRGRVPDGDEAVERPAAGWNACCTSGSATSCGRGRASGCTPQPDYRPCQIQFPEFVIGGDAVSVPLALLSACSRPHTRVETRSRREAIVAFVACGGPDVRRVRAFGASRTATDVATPTRRLAAHSWTPH